MGEAERREGGAGNVGDLRMVEEDENGNVGGGGCKGQ